MAANDIRVSFLTSWSGKSVISKCLRSPISWSSSSFDNISNSVLEIADTLAKVCVIKGDGYSGSSSHDFFTFSISISSSLPKYDASTLGSVLSCPIVAPMLEELSSFSYVSIQLIKSSKFVDKIT